MEFGIRIREVNQIRTKPQDLFLRDRNFIRKLSYVCLFHKLVFQMNENSKTRERKERKHKYFTQTKLNTYKQN